MFFDTHVHTLISSSTSSTENTLARSNTNRVAHLISIKFDRTANGHTSNNDAPRQLKLNEEVTRQKSELTKTSRYFMYCKETEYKMKHTTTTAAANNNRTY